MDDKGRSLKNAYAGGGLPIEQTSLSIFEGIL
jgi:hypothetical protein